MEEESVQVEETTEVSQPEVNTEETEALTEETQEQSSEETETTAEVETEVAPEPKVSRANERIRELVAQKKELEAQLKSREPEIEGVDADGIDPNKFAESLIKKAESVADRKYSYNKAIDEATHKFPEVTENDLVGTRATALMSEGYSPVQAAEIATLEWREQIEKETKKSAQRQQAGAKVRQQASLQSAGKSSPTGSGSFTRSEITNMSASEYTKNAKAINAQLEKYGAESFEE